MLLYVTFTQQKLQNLFEAFSQELRHTPYYYVQNDSKGLILEKNSLKTYSPAHFLTEKEFIHKFFNWYLENIILPDFETNPKETDNSISAIPLNTDGDLKMVVKFHDGKNLDPDFFEKVIDRAK